MTVWVCKSFHQRGGETDTCIHIPHMESRSQTRQRQTGCMDEYTMHSQRWEANVIIQVDEQERPRWSRRVEFVPQYCQAVKTGRTVERYSLGWKVETGRWTLVRDQKCDSLSGSRSKISSCWKVEFGHCQRCVESCSGVENEYGDRHISGQTEVHHESSIERTEAYTTLHKMRPRFRSTLPSTIWEHSDQRVCWNRNCKSCCGQHTVDFRNNRTNCCDGGSEHRSNRWKRWRGIMSAGWASVATPRMCR